METKVAMWMFAGLSSILVITNAAAQSCPANQIASDAQIILYGDTVNVIPETQVGAGQQADPNLTFLSEVLGYSDNQIQQEVQNSLHFFSERFGLEFSLTQPNELGQRFYQNATLRQVIEANVFGHAIINRWFLTGNTRSKCFLLSVGGFLVTFSGEQTLKGTYGGEEGVDVSTDRYVLYQYQTISVPPCEPIVFQYQTPIPLEIVAPQGNGIVVVFYELSHPTLGRGAQTGFAQVEHYTAANGTSFVRGAGAAVLTFPPNILTFN